MITKELQETGDRDWFYDCVEEASIRISHIENMSRRVASGLTRLGLGPGTVLHTAYNSQARRFGIFFPVNLLMMFEWVHRDL